MTKLKFGLFNKFNPVTKPKKETSNKISLSNKITKLISGVCIKKGNKYFISIDVNVIPKSHSDKIDYKSVKDNRLVLEFTDNSYNLKNVLAVFSRTKDKRGNYVRYIRDVSKARFFPGDTSKLVPFCDNWICTGHVVLKKDKLMFDFNECTLPKGYLVADIENEDE